METQLQKHVYERGKLLSTLKQKQTQDSLQSQLIELEKNCTSTSAPPGCGKLVEDMELQVLEQVLRPLPFALSPLFPVIPHFSTLAAILSCDAYSLCVCAAERWGGN